MHLKPIAQHSLRNAAGSDRRGGIVSVPVLWLPQAKVIRAWSITPLVVFFDHCLFDEIRQVIVFKHLLELA